MRISRRLLLALVTATVTVPLPAQTSLPASTEKSFTIAVIPDTQNYIDYLHQQDEGFPVNGRELFLEQMRYVASRLRSQGGDIDFVTSVGDVWQHQPLDIDSRSAARGFKAVPSAFQKSINLGANPNYKLEVATAIEGYKLIDGKVPFSVAPGNHDYDASWETNVRPLQPTSAQITGVAMVGGLDTFRSAFGADSRFFKGKSWYVASHDGGGDSAQIFSAGGYRFLHIALQFDPPNNSLEWATQVIRRYPGLPTIVTTHNYLNTQGERRSNPIIDQSLNDPLANNPQMVWDKFITQNDQIFMVLCGHQHAQSFRTDDNRYGHKVYQILADYQRRKRLLEGKELRNDMIVGLGDGWLRLMTFDMSRDVPIVQVRTYSSYYKTYSVDTVGYAQWYKAEEDPKLTDEDFLKEDHFTIELTDFKKRFKLAK